MTSPRHLAISSLFAVLTILTLNILFLSNEHKRTLELNLNRKLTSEITSIPGQAFAPWDKSSTEFPCVPEDSPDTQGIFYVKVPKTSSSTLGKITTRIAGRIAKRQGMDGEICKIYDPMVHHKVSSLNAFR